MFGVQIAKLSLRVVKLLNGTESRVLRYRNHVFCVRSLPRQKS
jgi:hypothetical protein